MTRCVGIDLDPVAPSMSVGGEALEGHGQSALAQFPLSLIKPVTRGEPLVLDRRWPASSRGSGLDAGLDPNSQRMPLAFLWQALALGSESRLNFGDTDVVGRGMSIGEALGFSAAQLAADLGNAGDELELALVVPNTIDEFAQDGLLQGLRHEARRQCLGRVREGLLWRPVAATLAWLSRHADSVAWRNRQPMQSVGCVFHLHLGIEGCEFTWVDLVPFQEHGGNLVLLPGRRSPYAVESLGLQPLAALESTLDSALIGREPDSEVRRRMAWHAAWLSPLLLPGGRASGASSVAEVDGLVPVSLLQDCLMDDLLSNLGSHHPAPGWTGSWLGSPKMTLSEWLGHVSRSDKVRCVGVVVSGNLALRRIASGDTLAGDVLRRIALPFAVPTELDAEVGPSLLAQGAELFAARRRQRLAGYLDSLPVVEMICMRDGEPSWVNLLDIGQRWAVGGRKTEFEPTGARFLIRKGQPELRITVHREGASTCRSVAAALGSRPDVDVPVRMKVAIDPGQGSPRVELLPEKAGLLRDKALVLDWDAARDTGRDRAAELAAVPRAYPPVKFRCASERRWLYTQFTKQGFAGCDGVLGLVRLFLAKPKLLLNPEYVKFLVGHLKAPEAGDQQNESTALSSDGELAAGVEGVQDLDALMGCVEDVLDSAMPMVVAGGYKIVAAASSGKAEVADRIRNCLENPRELAVNPTLLGAVFAASGQCLREPQHLGAFFRAFDDLIRQHCNKRVAWQIAEAISRIARYREGALRNCDSRKVEFWIEWLSTRLEARRFDGRMPLITARAAEAMAYLLRRRHFDQSCLSVGSAVQRMCKERVLAVVREPRSGDSPGVKRALAALRNVVDYIDGCGSGDVVVASDDDEE